MRTRFDRLDVGVGAASLILVLAIALTIAVGDRAGVGVTAMQPTGEAHTTTPIRIVFNEPMDAASVVAHFAIDPPIAGQFSWSGSQLTFKPSAALAANQLYTVTVRAGATSAQGRRLLEDVRWTFRVAPPHIAFLAPAVHEQEAEPPNLWIVDPAAPFVATQLTRSRYGLLDFQPSPDGTQIAYAEKAADDTADLYVITVDSGAIQRLTNCVKAICQSPAWSPDGSRIAYERIELNRDLPQIDQGLARAWIVNLKDLSTTPLIADSERLGVLPQWSPDGTQIAVYDRSLHGIAIYDLINGDRKLITTFVEETGAFAPDGTRLIYPELAQSPQQFYNTFAMADLAHPQNGIRPLNGRDGVLVDDHQAAWNPNGKVLAITRRYQDQPATCGAQVYLLNPDTAEAQPLVVDSSYGHGAIGWNPAGDQLVMQRYPCLEQDAQPGIWVYDLATKTLRQVARNGFIPHWLP